MKKQWILAILLLSALSLSFNFLVRSGPGATQSSPAGQALPGNRCEDPRPLSPALPMIRTI